MRTSASASRNAEWGAEMNPFQFEAPAWVNTTPENDPTACLDRARTASRAYYALGVQTGVHAMIEWCGVLSEHVRMLQHAHDVQGVDPRDVDQHSDLRLTVPSYMVVYFCAKLGCQLKPFIRGDAASWRREINKWFQE